jgi:hypothetical protein
MDCTSRLWNVTRIMKNKSYCSHESAFEKEMLYDFFKMTEAAGAITYPIVPS